MLTNSTKSYNKCQTNYQNNLLFKSKRFKSREYYSFSHDPIRKLSSFKGCEKDIFNACLKFINGFEIVNPSRETIAKEAGCSVKSVERCIKKWKEEGLLIIKYYHKAASDYYFHPLIFNGCLRRQLSYKYPEFKIAPKALIQSERNSKIIFENIKNVAQYKKLSCTKNLSCTIPMFFPQMMIYKNEMNGRGRRYNVESSTLWITSKNNRDKLKNLHSVFPKKGHVNFEEHVKNHFKKCYHGESDILNPMFTEIAMSEQEHDRLLMKIKTELELNLYQMEQIRSFQPNVVEKAYENFKTRTLTGPKFPYFLKCCHSVAIEFRKIDNHELFDDKTKHQYNPNHPPYPRWQYNRQENLDYFDEWYKKHGEQYALDMGIPKEAASRKFMQRLEKQLNDPSRKRITEDTAQMADLLKTKNLKKLRSEDFNNSLSLTAIELAGELYKIGLLDPAKIKPNQFNFILDENFKQQMLNQWSHKPYKTTGEAGESIAIAYINKIKRKFDTPQEPNQESSQEFSEVAQNSTPLKDSDPKPIKYYLNKILGPNDNVVDISIEENKSDITEDDLNLIKDDDNPFEDL